MANGLIYFFGKLKAQCLELTAVWEQKYRARVLSPDLPWEGGQR
jgi:hypothetical protein